MGPLVQVLAFQEKENRFRPEPVNNTGPFSEIEKPQLPCLQRLHLEPVFVQIQSDFLQLILTKYVQEQGAAETSSIGRMSSLTRTESFILDIQSKQQLGAGRKASPSCIYNPFNTCLLKRATWLSRQYSHSTKSHPYLGAKTQFAVIFFIQPAEGEKFG